MVVKLAVAIKTPVDAPSELIDLVLRVLGAERARTFPGQVHRRTAWVCDTKGASRTNTNNQGGGVRVRVRVRLGLGLGIYTGPPWSCPPSAERATYS